MVKLFIQEVLVLVNNYSRILVLLNNYFSFFEFWSNLVCHVCRRPGLIGLTSYYCQENNKCRLGNEGE